MKHQNNANAVDSIVHRNQWNTEEFKGHKDVGRRDGDGNENGLFGDDMDEFTHIFLLCFAARLTLFDDLGQGTNEQNQSGDGKENIKQSDQYQHSPFIFDNAPQSVFRARSEPIEIQK